MNILLHWLTAPEWSQVVKTLLHSLWQGALIAAALVLIIRRLANPYARYRCSLVALAAIPAAGIITWAILNATNHQPLPAPLPTATEAATPPALIPLNQSPVTKLIVFADHTPAPPQSRWTAWLALAWLVGAVVMLGRAGVKVAGAERLRRTCRPLNHPQIAQLVAEAQRAVGLARKIRVAVTDKLTSPAVVGVLVPTLILPLSLVTTLSPEQIRFILLHELTHIRRGDYFANLFQLFVEALLFFNPAVWWISHQVRREREACCDALAIELSGAPADYARTLVHVAEIVLSPTPASASAFGGDREPSSLADRVQRLLVPGYRPSLRLTWRAMIGAFVLGATLLVLSAEGTRVAVAELTKSPTQSTGQKEASSQESKPKLETASHSSENLNAFKPTSSALDSDKHTLSGPENLGGMTDWQVDAANMLPLPALRLNQVPSAALSNKLPFLFDLPWVRKLFTSSQTKSVKTDFVQLSQLSTLNKEIRSEHNITDSLSIRFQDMAAGNDLVLAQLDRQNDRLAANDNVRTEFTLGSIPKLSGNSALKIDPYNQVGMNSWTVDGQNLLNQQWFWYRVGKTNAPGSEASTRIESHTQSINQRSPKPDSPALEVSGVNDKSRVEHNLATGKTVITNGGLVRFNDTTVRADSIQLDQKTRDLVASGNVWIETPDGVAKSANANLNIHSNALLSAVSGNLSYTSEKRRAMMNKLTQIQLDQVYFNETPLSLVIGRLQMEIWRRDSDGLGITFVFNHDRNRALTSKVIKSPDDLLDLFDTRVTINPPLTNVSVLDALQAIVKGAAKPIRFGIEENAVVISAGKGVTPLFMREFKVKPTLFENWLAENGFPITEPSGTTNSTHIAKSIRGVLAKAGIDLEPTKAKSIYYDDKKGNLLVRATKEELDQVENLLRPILSQSQANRSASITTNASGLYTRTFRVDPNTFGKALESITATPVTGTNITGAVRSFFATLGVELTPPKGVYYNDRAGELLVRSTTEDLDVIEATLMVADKPTPQVSIKVRFVEVERGETGSDWFLGTISNQSISHSSAANPATGTASNAASQSFTGILTDPQFRVVLRALEQRNSSSLFSESEVTTLSGRQAQVQAGEMKTVINGIDQPTIVPGQSPNNDPTNLLYKTRVQPFGPVLDVIPTVSEDGYTVQLTVIPTVTEFLGYDDPGKALPRLQAGSNDISVLPLPRMRLRQVIKNAVVTDGQTLVLGVANDQIITKQADGGILKEPNPDAEKKQLLIFITATIVDPAGNRSNVNSLSRPQRW